MQKRHIAYIFIGIIYEFIAYSLVHYIFTYIADYAEGGAVITEQTKVWTFFTIASAIYIGLIILIEILLKKKR